MGTFPFEQPKSALVLGYDEGRTSLFGSLEDRGFHVSHSSEPVSSFAGFELVVGFGYKHLIEREALLSAIGPVINIHISYLPHNRGMHPIFWSFFDETPLGVTIHEIDEGLDSGPIWKRKELHLPNGKMTFREAHGFMIRCAEHVFEESIEGIVSGELTPFPQEFQTRPHKASDLPAEFRGWDAPIVDEIIRLQRKSLQPRQSVT